MTTDPMPWDEDPTPTEPEAPAEEPREPDALALVLATDTEAATLSYRDPQAVALFAQDLRRAVRENVRRILAEASAERIVTDRPDPATFAPEVALAADVADTLTEVADAIRSGVEVTRDHLGTILDELGDPAKATRSIRVADGHGQDVKATESTPHDLSVAVDDVVGVIATDLAQDEDLEEAEGEAYRTGAEDGMRALLGVYLSSPKWKSTALDGLKRALQDDGRHAEAIALGRAYGRVPSGSPRVKVERLERSKRGRA